MSDFSTPTSEVSAKRRSSTRYAYYVFWIMFIISLINYMDRYVLSGAANTIATELGFGPEGIGYISSAFVIIYTLGAVPLGIWADRTARKNVVAICVAIWSATTALTALANSFFTLFISRMVLGIGEAGYFPAGTALMSDYFHREQRSRIMSWWSCGQLFGILAGFGLGGALAGLYIGSWRLAFLITGVPGLILAYLVWRVREPRRNQADEEADADSVTEQEDEAVDNTLHPVIVPSNVLSQFWTLLRIKTLFVLIAMQIFAFFVLGVNTTFLPTFLQQSDTYKLSSGAAGLYAGVIIVVAGMIGTVFGGYLADWLNRYHPGARVLVCGIGFLIGAPSFALAVLADNLAIFTVFFIITAILLTIYTGPSTAATQDVVPSVLRASSIAITLLIAHLLGDAVSPSIVGVLTTAFDPTGGAHFASHAAGHDMSMALLITCTPALAIAGLIGVFGARWMKSDVAAAELADKRMKQELASTSV